MSRMLCLVPKKWMQLGRVPNLNSRLDHSYAKSSRSSINPIEVSHFDKLASTWWDPHGSSRLLHQMNPVRHDFIASCAATYSNEFARVRYLDIGCGGGIFTESVARLPQTESVLGIDPSTEVIKVAQEHARCDHQISDPAVLQYQNKTLENLAEPINSSEQFDFVTLFEVIEHIDDPAKFIESATSFVKPGGWLIISTIARTWTSWLTTKLIAENVIGLVPKGTHEWSKYINSEELCSVFNQKSGWASGGGMKVMGVIYIPGFGWSPAKRSEIFGNYFFGVRRDLSR